MSRLLILSPGHPHAAGGVTDHTSRLVASWSAAGHGVVVLADPAARPPAADGLLIQYVPFLYGRRGLSDAPRRTAWEAHMHGTRVVVFVHEPWVPATRPSWWILSPLQRRQLRRLLDVADASVTAVPAWRDMLGPGTDLMYVGSTLGPPAGPPSDRLTGPVVFSPFAAGLRWDWITAAIEQLGASPPLIVLGADAAALARHPATRALDRTGWDARGRLDAHATLGVLRAAPLVLAPFADGLTGRRTSAAAAFSVGARVVTSHGHLADPRLRAGAAGAAASAGEYARVVEDVWNTADGPDDRARRIAWYRDHLDPATLDARLLDLVRGAR